MKYVAYDGEDILLNGNGSPSLFNEPLDDGDTYLLVTALERPGYDYETEYLAENRVIDLVAGEWRNEWSIVPLDPAIIAERLEAANDRDEREQARQIYSVMKNITTAELSTPEDMAQHLVRVSRVAARLIKDAYGSPDEL